MAPVAAMKTTCRISRPARARNAACHALNGERALAAATCTAAAVVVLTAAPAIAGVSLEQPKLKKFVTEGTEEVMQKELPDPAAKLKKKAESAVSKAAAPKAAAEESMSGQFSTQALWPFGLVAVPAGLYALSKVDPGTEKLFEQGWVKDSTQVGIGFEDKLKGKGGYMSPYYAEGYQPNQKGAKKLVPKLGKAAAKR